MMLALHLRCVLERPILLFFRLPVILDPHSDRAVATAGVVQGQVETQAEMTVWSGSWTAKSRSFIIRAQKPNDPR